MTTETSPSDRTSALRRLPEQGMVAGVAAGLAEHFGIDPTLVRVGLVALVLMGGAGVPLYLAAWLLLPEQGSERSIADELLRRSGAR